MNTNTNTQEPLPAKIPWYRNPQTRALVIQIVFGALVAITIYTIFTNTITNLEARGIKTSFDFFFQVAPFNIGFSAFREFILGQSKYWDVFVIGIGNTLLVSFLGIIATALFGFIVGVLRLSPNFLVSNIATVYIETVRNIPLLLQIMFWNFAILLPSLPPPRQSFALFDSIFLNNRGLYLPKIVAENTWSAVLIALSFIVAIVIIVLFRRHAKRKLDTTGISIPTFIPSLLIFILLPALVIFGLQNNVQFDFPALQKFNFSGGLAVPLPLFVLWFALTFYTTAFVAETVRGGILAVNKGQTEAASALGLHRGLVLKLVVIPQALRVIIPPSISQFLNLTKNSSLAVAIGYEELVNVWSGIALNQTGQALIIIAMTILVYETLSLVTSGILNWYNSRIQLVER